MCKKRQLNQCILRYNLKGILGINKNCIHWYTLYISVVGAVIINYTKYIKSIKLWVKLRIVVFYKIII